MKVSELEVGKKYKCVLSDQEMLIAKTEKVEPVEDGDDIVKEYIVGKLCVMQEGVPRFLYNELHDGQMVEIKN